MGRSKAAAEKALSEALRDRARTDAGAEITADTRLSIVAEAWFTDFSRQDRSPTTLAAYRDRLDKQILPALGNVGELTVGLVDRHLRAIETKHSPAMAKQTKTVLGQVVGPAVRHDALIQNLDIFVVMSLLSLVKVDIAVGFGLFATLSIIRLRSSAVTQQEVAYYFVALVMGLLKGMGVPDHGLVVAPNALLLAVMVVFDSTPLRDRSRRVDVQLKKLYTSNAALVADLERELGGRVMYHEVTEIDVGHRHITVDVRYRPGTGVAQELDEVAVDELDRPREVVTAPAAEAPEVQSPDRVDDLVHVGGGEVSRHRAE